MTSAAPFRTSPLRGEIFVPSDKSLTHRAIMFGSVAEGETVILPRTIGRDNLATLRAMQQLGVRIICEFGEGLYEIAREEKCENVSDSKDGRNRIVIGGKGFRALIQPTGELDCGNSGTSARLLCGLLAGCPFAATLTGDASLRRRPFKRVITPLSLMGARFSCENLPFSVTGGSLKGIHFDSPVASAQVKSAILIAGIQTEAEVSVTEPMQSRDHTERMFKAMGVDVRAQADARGRWQVTLGDKRQLRGLGEIEIPGDFSAAAFFIVAGLIVPGSEILIRNVGLNKTRIGLFGVLKRMGAKLTLKNERQSGGEEVGDILIEAGELRGVEVTPADVVLAVDEIPVLAVAAAFASGETRITGAGELRVKESDRLAMISKLLADFESTVDELPDGLVIHGKSSQRKRDEPRMEEKSWQNSGDHRIAMCASLLNYALKDEFELHDQAAVETSFPYFLKTFRALRAKT